MSAIDDAERGHYEEACNSLCFLAYHRDTSRSLPEVREVDLMAVETTRLWDAIKVRFNQCVLLYEQAGEKKDYLANGYLWWGSPACVLGLCYYGVQRLKDLLRKLDRSHDQEGHEPK